MDSKKVLPVVYAIIHMERRMIFQNLKERGTIKFQEYLHFAAHFFNWLIYFLIAPPLQFTTNQHTEPTKPYSYRIFLPDTPYHKYFITEFSNQNYTLVY